MLHLLKKESITVPAGVSLLLMILLIFPFARDVIYNEIFLASFEKQIKQYSHPPDSKLIQKISLIGNFAPASNQCGFIVAQVRTTLLKPDDIHTFYAPILTTSSYDKDPPYHAVSLYILGNEKEVEDIMWFYPEVYELITQKATKDTHAYLLITSETGYPPNYDLRCH